MQRYFLLIVFYCFFCSYINARHSHFPDLEGGWKYSIEYECNDGLKAENFYTSIWRSKSPAYTYYTRIDNANFEITEQQSGYSFTIRIDGNCSFRGKLVYKEDAGEETLSGLWEMESYRGASSSAETMRSLCCRGTISFTRIKTAETKLQFGLQKEGISANKKSNHKTTGIAVYAGNNAPIKKNNEEPALNTVDAVSSKNNNTISNQPQNNGTANADVYKTTETTGTSTGHLTAATHNNHSNTSFENNHLPREANAVTKHVPDISKLENKNFETIYTGDSIIVLRFYDNGLLDGDTVNIFHNGRLITANHRLTDAAFEYSVVMSGYEKEHIVTMHAVNPGSIPPNTAMLKFTVNGRPYSVNLSADEKTTASIKLVRDH